jgi:hypothetical protein
LSSEESAKFLELQPSGTFLLRFSKSKAGSFALAYVDKDKNIGHSLIQYTPSGFSIHENSQQTDRNRVFDKLDRLVEHYSFILKTPLDTTLSRQPWFHGDLDKDESFELLRSKADGSFLIRFSSKRGYLTISFVSSGTCNHTIIEPGENGQGWLCDGKSYPSIEQFLEENKATFKIPVETLIMGTASGPASKKSSVRSSNPSNLSRHKLGLKNYFFRADFLIEGFEEAIKGQVERGKVDRRLQLRAASSCRHIAPFRCERQGGREQQQLR